MSNQEILKVKQFLEADAERKALEARKQQAARDIERAKKTEQERQKQERLEEAIAKVKETRVFRLFEALRDKEMVIGREHKVVTVTKLVEKSSWEKFFSGGEYNKIYVKEDLFEPAKIEFFSFFPESTCPTNDPEEGLLGVVLKFNFYGYKPTNSYQGGDWGWSKINARLYPEGRIVINGVEVENNLEEVVAKAILNPWKESFHQDSYDGPG